MKRLTLTILSLLMMILPVQKTIAQTSGACPGIGTTTPLGNGLTLTVSSTAVPFTAGAISTGGRSAVVATCKVEGDAIRYWDNGQTPTAAVGKLVPVLSEFMVCGRQAISNFLAIRVTTDATVTCTFYAGS